MRTLRFLALWWLALGAWWILLVGTNAGLEEIAAACSAVLATALAFGARRHGLLRFRFEPGWLAKTLLVPWRVVRELTVVLWALALHLTRVRPVGSAYRAIPFPAGRAEAAHAGRRAIAMLADAVSPNAYSIDADCERDVVLRHELDPRRSSNEIP